MNISVDRNVLNRFSFMALLMLGCFIGSLLAAPPAWALDANRLVAHAIFYQNPGDDSYTLVLQNSPKADPQYGEIAYAHEMYDIAPSDFVRYPNFYYENSEVAEKYNDKVTSIVCRDKIIAPTNCDSLFDFPNCETIDISKLDTSRTTSMHMMFDCCYKLKALDVSNFNTSNVTDMDSMFSACTSLTTLDLSSFDTSNVTDMNKMFSYDFCLRELDTSSFDTSRVTNMNMMFFQCPSLKSLDLSHFNTENVTSMYGMFAGASLNDGDCFKPSTLESVNLSSFDTSKVNTMFGMFFGCVSLKSILVSPSFTTSALSGYQADLDMFGKCANLKGGNGTEYSDDHTDKEYARIDAPGLPGYFTRGVPTPRPSKPTNPKPQTPSASKPATPPAASVKPAQPTSIAKAQMTVKSKAYTGKTLKPSSVTVKVGGKKLVSGRDYIVSCKGGKAVGSYKVTVKGKGAYAGTKSATFQIVPKGTSVSKTKAAKRGFTVTWKKPSKANLKQTTGYKVQWSTDKSFKKSVKSKLIGKGKTSLKVSKLKGGKKYYVRVCAYKKAGGKYYYSAWSKVKAVKTKK